MNNCQVSIVIPVFNLEKYIKKCLDSVVEQTCFEKIEVIVINDGSTDDSINILNEYEKKYQNIKIISQKNSGVSSARNNGIENAKGKYILFVDGDDFLEKTYVERMLNATENEKYDLIVADYWVYFSQQNLKRYRKENKIKIWSNDQAIKELLSGGNVGNNLFDKMFNRKLIGNVRFNSDIKIGEDLLFIYQYLKNINNVKGIFEPGYYYVQREGSAMNSKFNKKQFDILKVSKIISDDISNEMVNICEAFCIYNKYKILERAYKSFDYKSYESDIKKIKNDIKNYSLFKAFRFMSRKRFYGYILIKCCPRLYLFACKIKKI